MTKEREVNKLHKTSSDHTVNEGAISLAWYGRLRVGYILPLYTDQSHTWHGWKGWPFYYHFSEQNTRVAWQLRFRLCEGGILWGEQSFTVKKGSKKERRPIANRQLLYQSSLLPNFLPHGATVTHTIYLYSTLSCCIHTEMINLIFGGRALPLNPIVWRKADRVYHCRTTFSPSAINRYFMRGLVQDTDILVEAPPGYRKTFTWIVLFCFFLSFMQ